MIVTLAHLQSITTNRTNNRVTHSFPPNLGNTHEYATIVLPDVQVEGLGLRLHHLRLAVLKNENRKEKLDLCGTTFFSNNVLKER